jgi:hypothetical protein
VNKGDQLIERGAHRLEELSRQAAAKGGIAAKLADELAEDATFLRKLKPSLIRARAKGRAPTDEPRDAPPKAPSAPQIATPRPSHNAGKGGRSGGGPNPFLVAGAALAAGIVLAKVIDWRSHAHPRD